VDVVVRRRVRCPIWSGIRVLWDDARGKQCVYDEVS
jgi:hypothetical protein